MKAVKYALSSIVSGGTPEVANDTFWARDGDPGHYWVAITDMTRGVRIRTTERRITEAGRASKDLRVVPPGTLLYSMYASLGKVAVLEVPASFNQAILALVPNTNKLHQGFLRFWLNSMESRLELFSSSNTQDNLNAAKVRAMPLFMPNMDEQRAIADFLDRETAKIDSLIAKKGELIERLKEKRAALISRTVVRGLPPEAAREAGFEASPTLRSSGTEWFGKLPAHWRLAQLSRYCSILDCVHRTVSFVDDGIPLASIREVHGFEVDLSNAKQTTEDEYLRLVEGDRRPRIGDIIFSRNATVGDSAIVATAERFAVGQDVCLIRAREQHPKYLLYLLRSAPLTQQLESFMVGATFRRINVGQIKSLWVCWPPVAEQQAIAEFLDRAITSINQMAAKVESAIACLQEYRSALISAAMTGKIDVRREVVDNRLALASFS